MNRIINVVKVLGRGNIIVCNNEDLHVGDSIRINNTEFEIRAIEGSMTLMVSPRPSKTIGIILYPNDIINKEMIGKEITKPN